MAGKGVLIVSPLNVKFQCPFPHIQKRQLSLLNLGPQPIVYSIAIENKILFQVYPSTGRLWGFETIELSIMMKPTVGDQQGSSLMVKHKVKETSDNQVASEDWTDVQAIVVEITLENSIETEKELRDMIGSDGSAKDLIQIMEKQYQPLCHKCCMKRFQQPIKERSWMRRMWWPFLLVLLSALSE